MYKSREEILSLESDGRIKYVVVSSEKWKQVLVSEKVLKKVEAYLTSLNTNIYKFWLSKGLNPAYQQTFDKNQKYLDLFKSANNDELAKAISEVDKRVEDLIANWKETPTDQALPPVIEHSIYLRSILQAAQN